MTPAAASRSPNQPTTGASASQGSRSTPISSLMQLETPHAVVDAARVQANIARVAEYARDQGLKLRPHTKTHKDPEIARLQLQAGAIGVTCATPREAEVMVEISHDILVAYPPVDPHRIERLLALPRHVDLKIALDSVEAVERLGRAAQKRSVGVLIELDLGGQRTGIADETSLLAIAQAIDESPRLRFLGLMVHPGNLHHPVNDPGDTKNWSTAQQSNLAQELESLSTRLRIYIDTLKAVGHQCKIVSGGNTPSLFFNHLVPELTEIRPGTYVYCDRDIASQGIFSWKDCAYSVLATVVSTAVPGQAVIDAGTKALAREPLAGLEGFGALLDRPEVIVKGMSEEHGILDLGATDWKPQVGDRVRVVPNHVCVSVHLQDRVAFVQTGDLEVREVAARGR